MTHEPTDRYTLQQMIEARDQIISEQASNIVKLRDQLLEEREYLETVDAMLDGVVEARDRDGKNIWLKERVEILIAKMKKYRGDQ